MIRKTIQVLGTFPVRSCGGSWNELDLRHLRASRQPRTGSITARSLSDLEAAAPLRATVMAPAGAAWPMTGSCPCVQSLRPSLHPVGHDGSRAPASRFRVVFGAEVVSPALSVVPWLVLPPRTICRCRWPGARPCGCRRRSCAGASPAPPDPAARTSTPPTRALSCASIWLPRRPSRPCSRPGRCATWRDSCWRDAC